MSQVLGSNCNENVTVTVICYSYWDLFIFYYVTKNVTDFFLKLHWLL